MGSYRGNMELVHCYFRCTFNTRVESVREGGKVRQRIVKYYGSMLQEPLMPVEPSVVPKVVSTTEKIPVSTTSSESVSTTPDEFLASLLGSAYIRIKRSANALGLSVQDYVKKRSRCFTGWDPKSALWCF